MQSTNAIAMEEPALFEPQHWLESFRRAKEANDRDALGRLRQSVQKETLEVLKTMSYHVNREILVDLHYVRPTVATTPPSQLPSDRTTFHVLNSDGVDVASFLKEKRGLNPAVVVCGSVRRLEDLSIDKQASIYCRSSLSASLKETGGQASYVPRVVVFRASENRGYAFLRDPKEMAFICSRELSRALPGSDGRLRREDAKEIETQIKNIFRCALQNGHDSLVLGHGLNQSFLAEPFLRVFKSRSFSKTFRYVAFAIQEEDGILKSFQEKFNENE